MKRAANIIFILFVFVSVGVTKVSAEEKIAYVTFCFDDAHGSIFGYALPIFQQNGISATIYVPTIGIDEKPYWHMSWKQIVALQKSGWEIGSHSHTHTSMIALSPEQIDEELKVSQGILAEHGIVAKTFASPLGDFNDDVIKGVKKYYVAHRGVEKVRGQQLELSLNDLDVDPFDISSIQLWYDDSLFKINELIERAIKEKKWAVFYLHAISEGQQEDKNYKFDVHALSMLMSHLSNLQKEGKIKIVTVAGFLEQRKKH